VQVSNTVIKFRLETIFKLRSNFKQYCTNIYNLTSSLQKVYGKATHLSRQTCAGDIAKGLQEILGDLLNAKEDYAYYIFP